MDIGFIFAFPSSRVGFIFMFFMWALHLDHNNSIASTTLVQGVPQLLRNFNKLIYLLRIPFVGPRGEEDAFRQVLVSFCVVSANFDSVFQKTDG